MTGGTKLPPVRFLHVDLEMPRGGLQVGEGQIPLGIGYATDLIKPGHGITHMGGIGHWFLARSGKGEGR